jgi:hypothetical protein
MVETQRVTKQPSTTPWQPLVGFPARSSEKYSRTLEKPELTSWRQPDGLEVFFLVDPAFVSVYAHSQPEIMYQ